MPAPVPLPLRQAIWTRHQQGASTSELAEQFGLAPRTVRGLIRRARERGVEGLTPDPTHSNRLSPSPYPAREAALQLRREHPAWGAGMVRVWLERAGVGGLPSTREIQRWFAGAGLNPAPRGRRPQSARRPARAPHETWQVDASERMTLADGSQASWLRVTDESTGAVLLTAVFPPRALGLGPRGGISKDAPAGVSPMGPPRAHPRRQRLAVGFAPGRPAERTGLVADRTENRRHLERTPQTSAERRGGAKPGHGKAVGRAGSLRRRRRIAIQD